MITRAVVYRLKKASGKLGESDLIVLYEGRYCSGAGKCMLDLQRLEILMALTDFL